MTEAIGITPDAVLLRRISQGDSEAAAHLHRRHSISLYALAYGVLMDPTDADLVVEDTFAHVTKRAAEFDSETMAAHSWLAETARGHVRAILHSRRPERHPEDPDRSSVG